MSQFYALTHGNAMLSQNSVRHSSIRYAYLIVSSIFVLSTLDMLML